MICKPRRRTWLLVLTGTKTICNRRLLFCIGFCLTECAKPNCTIAEVLERLAAVTSRAKAKGLRASLYVSVVAICAYRSTRLQESETSHGLPRGALPATQLAAISTTLTVPASPASSQRSNWGCVLTFDASVAGLGECSCSPGATGNVATEDVLEVRSVGQRQQDAR
ncbi:uncharacterized protein C8Q71DRAFT_284664 [Rhodofomes roseus]|uniref:Secreted protein n=1 Tax=Rhodofomes roseus TaxID=34475 RepID=A0ABQ8K4H9_9APHY|nr:uncharacterized protein C8Q71DRAFT_284664 [Rhodofomes roseus]KAH9831775.1 hypothetical protein C8Q71DRAFT_284664 [Rhodofomes roseus]